MRGRLRPPGCRRRSTVSFRRSVIGPGLLGPPRAVARGWLRELTPARRERWALTASLLDEQLLPADSRVLDVGCADGLLTARLAAARPQWMMAGLDLSAEAIALAVQQRQRLGVGNLELVRADATRLPAPSGSADLVLALECLAEIPDDAAVATELARVLRPGGLLVIHVPHADWVPVLSGSPRTWRREVRHGYTEDSVCALLQAAGLRITSVRGSMRTPVMLTQEVVNRTASPVMRLALYPLAAGVVRVAAGRLAFGAARGLLVTATR